MTLTKSTWEEMTPRERYERLAWSVATSCVIETGGDVTKVYEELMKRKCELPDVRLYEDDLDVSGTNTESRETN